MKKKIIVSISFIVILLAIFVSSIFIYKVVTKNVECSDFSQYFPDCSFEIEEKINNQIIMDDNNKHALKFLKVAYVCSKDQNGDCNKDNVIIKANVSCQNENNHCFYLVYNGNSLNIINEHNGSNAPDKIFNDEFKHKIVTFLNENLELDFVSNDNGGDQ